MGEGHGRDRWARTSLLAAILANANRDAKRSRPFRPADFNPYTRQDRRVARTADKESLAILKAALEARKGSGNG